MTMESMHPETRTVHLPVAEVTGSRPLTVPIYQGHMFAFDDPDPMGAAFSAPSDTYAYNRMGNPTVRSFELAAAELEGGAAAFAAASGMGAINSVLLALLRPGDHVVAQRSLYGGTTVVLDDLAARWGIQVSYLAEPSAAAIEQSLRPQTRLLYLETISNPLTRVTDLPAATSAARGAAARKAASGTASGPRLITVVDNTFAPMLCAPLRHGADIVVHSATKYLGGHGDVLGGVAVFADPELYRQVWHYATELGAITDPFAAWLTLRGMQTLGLRIRRQCDTALLLAARLAENPVVTAVHYPGLPGHPDHAVATRLLTEGAGGVLAFELAGGREAGRVFSTAIRLIALAPSLGDVKSLVLHPASTSHQRLSEDQLTAAGIGPGLIRLSAGLEHPEDLWPDLEQALAKAS